MVLCCFGDGTLGKGSHGLLDVIAEFKGFQVKLRGKAPYIKTGAFINVTLAG